MADTVDLNSAVEIAYAKIQIEHMLVGIKLLI